MNKREKVFSKTKGKCIYCGCTLDYYNFHIEHMIPKSKLKNDKSNINNLFPSCIDCNLLKGNLEIEDFREKLENFIFDDTRCRTLARYYNIKPKNILFYFERNGG